jgi:plasmid maintenance system antidote protein VapI
LADANRRETISPLAAKKKTRTTSPISPELASLPSRLKAARETREMTSTGLDEAAGVSQGRVSRAEQGKRLDGLTADAALKLSSALRIHVEWLLTGRGEMWLDGSGNAEPVRSTLRPTSSRRP